MVYKLNNDDAGVVKLVDTHGLGPCAERCVGSSPTSGIIILRGFTLRVITQRVANPLSPIYGFGTIIFQS